MIVAYSGNCDYGIGDPRVIRKLSCSSSTSWLGSAALDSVWCTGPTLHTCEFASCRLHGW